MKAPTQGGHFASALTLGPSARVCCAQGLTLSCAWADELVDTVFLVLKKKPLGEFERGPEGERGVGARA
jgi:hypothetical protein